MRFTFAFLAVGFSAAVIATAPAAADEAKPSIQFLNPPTVAAPPSPSYTHLAIVPAHSEIFVVAGQVGIRPDGTIPESPEEQYEITLQNIVDILKSQGLSPSSIVKMNTYAAKDINIAKVREIRKRVLGNIAPPGTWVHVVKLVGPQYAVEIEAWAARPR